MGVIGSGRFAFGGGGAPAWFVSSLFDLLCYTVCNTLHLFAT